IERDIAAVAAHAAPGVQHIYHATCSRCRVRDLVAGCRCTACIQVCVKDLFVSRRWWGADATTATYCLIFSIARIRDAEAVPRNGGELTVDRTRNCPARCLGDLAEHSACGRTG